MLQLLMWTNFSFVAFLFPKGLLFGFFTNWFSCNKFSHLCTFEKNVCVTFVFENILAGDIYLQCNKVWWYFFLFFRDVSLFLGMHAFSNTSALVLISDLVDVRYIFPLTAFNNFYSTTCFKQFDCDRFRRNYISFSELGILDL